MRQLFNIRSFLALAASLMLPLLGGCSQEEQKQGNIGKESIINMSVSARNQAIDPETEITSLRMLVFNAADKSLVLNQRYDPAEVFNQIDDNYLLNARIKYIPKARIFVIANERPQWLLDNGITYGGLQTLEADYFDPTLGLSDVTAPFLMLAGGDEDVPMPADSKIEKKLTLVRNVVKVTLKLKQKLLTSGGTAPVTLKKLYIDRLPKKGFLYPGVKYDPADTYTKTAQRDLETVGFDLSSDYSTLKEDQIFYIPENLLSDKAHYSRILITATRNTGEGGDILYEIPLGENVQKLYDTNAPVSMDDLTAGDLSAKRSTHFVIDATISLSDVNAAVKVKEWVLKEIQGEISAPYLNISSLDEPVIVYYHEGLYDFVCEPDPIVFYVWTNLGKEDLKLDLMVQKDSEAAVPLTDVFNYKWTVTEQEEGFLPGVATATGKLELSFKDPEKNWGSYKMKVSAKNLTRSFQISLAN